MNRIGFYVPFYGVEIRIILEESAISQMKLRSRATFRKECSATE